METWPVALQQILNTSGFQKTFGSTSIRSDNDIGPAKVRARFTDAVDTYTTTIWLDFTSYSIFETFFKTQLNNGILPFQFPEPFTQNLDTFRFIEPPKIRPLGGLEFEVEMSWERMP